MFTFDSVNYKISPDFFDDALIMQKLLSDLFISLSFSCPRTSIIKEKKKQQILATCGGKRNIYALLVGTSISPATVETARVFLTEK